MKTKFRREIFSSQTYHVLWDLEVTESQATIPHHLKQQIISHCFQQQQKTGLETHSMNNVILRM